MNPKTFNKKVGPEAIIQKNILAFLRMRGWYCMETHGNLYQAGFPDVYATHSTYGVRWIEVKNPKAYSFTPAQLECFPKLSANGTRIWILVDASETEYKKLFQPPNWESYFIAKQMRNIR